MLTNDFIVEQSKMTIKLLTTVLVAPDGGLIEDVDEIKFSGDQLEMQKTLQELLEENQICQAEDKVF